MLSGLPAPDNERRIIPFPRAVENASPGFFSVGRADGRLAEEPEPRAGMGRGMRPLPGEEAARHYLKFMLPSIPIIMFVMAFVYCALLVGARESALGDPSSVRVERADSALPLVGALLLAGTSAALCVMIYLGYLRASGQER